jgi:hypothetical protein
MGTKVSMLKHQPAQQQNQNQGFLMPAKGPMHNIPQKLMSKLYTQTTVYPYNLQQQEMYSSAHQNFSNLHHF